MEPLFPQTEWISFPSLASALRTSRGQWDALTPHGRSPGASTYDPVVYLLSLHSAPSFPARSHSGRTAPTASGGVRMRRAIPAPYTHPGHTAEQAARQTGHSQRSPVEQRAELHKAQVSLSLAQSGHTARAGPGSHCPSLQQESGQGERGCYCHQPLPPCTQTAQISEPSEQLELTSSKGFPPLTDLQLHWLTAHRAPGLHEPQPQILPYYISKCQP